MEIDLNSDLGEGCGQDEAIMALVSSANVCCGFHAGDRGTALAALQSAGKHQVTVGAHPGYADREHFGRREFDYAEGEIRQLCLDQVGVLLGLAQSAGVRIAYIKPHGALYNQACRDERFAAEIVDAAEKLGLPLLALPGSQIEVCSRGRVAFFAEGFADRRYLDDGSLVPRSQTDAMVTDVNEARRQASCLIQERGVHSLCVHGDNPQALAFVSQLRAGLEQGGWKIRPFIGVE